MTIATVSKRIEDYQLTKEELENMKRDAYIEGNYRYFLTRVWDEDLPRVMWILLNPSTADDNVDDPTVKKCMGFAKGWGYGSIEIVNLFAYRATKPKNLKEFITCEGEEVAVGSKRDKYIETAANRSKLIILGWGNNAIKFKAQCNNVIELLADRKLEIKYLDINKSRQPKHPLFVAYLDAPDVDSLLDYRCD